MLLDASGNSDKQVLQTHATWHLAATFFHVCLITFALTIGLANSDIDWQSEYLLYNRELYLMTSDRKPTIDKVDLYKDLVKTNASADAIAYALAQIPHNTDGDKYRIDYLVQLKRHTTLFYLISVFWSNLLFKTATLFLLKKLNSYTAATSTEKVETSPRPHPTLGPFTETQLTLQSLCCL